MGWWSDRLGTKRGSNPDQPRSASELGDRLNRQRAKWFETVTAEVRDGEQLLGSRIAATFDEAAASLVVSAFQAVHVLSLANANNYLAASEMGPFTRELCSSLSEGRVTEKWKNAVEHYTNLKSRPVGEQLLNFSEEVAITLSGSGSAGMLLGPGLVRLANEFLIRNHGITADFFGDDATTRATAKAVRSMQEGA